MTFANLNLTGILIAFGFSFISGAIWFGPRTFYPIWMKARGVSSGQLSANQNKPILLFGGTIIGLLIQILALGIIISTIQVGRQNFSTIDGALVGLILGVGIAAFASLSHRLFGGESIKVWLIETTNDSINLAVAGAIIAYFN
jgi:hypothetical protein